MDQPLADPSCIALYFVSRLASHYVKVVLSGEGADELFGGYTCYNDPRVFKIYQTIVPHCIRKAIRAICRKLPDIKGRDYLIRACDKLEERYIGNAFMYDYKQKQELLKDPSIATRPQDLTRKYYYRCRKYDDVTKMQYLDINMWMVGDILLKADRMSMANSLELRVPFLDKEVFKVASSLPTKLRCNKHNTKYAMRKAAVRHMPEATAEKETRTRKNEYHAKTVILATGAEHRALNVPGEKELSGMGVSYCATCDGAFFKDKTVAVIGGGDVAVEDAIFLARTCKKVYVIHRRDELRAAGVLQDALLALPNVEMVWDTVVDSIEGNEMVSGVKVTNKKAGEAGVITVDGVFIAVGIVPVSALIAGIVETDEAGYIKAGEDGVTSVPGVFAAGDVRTKQLRQIITAAADGANCVTSVEKYLISH